MSATLLLIIPVLLLAVYVNYRWPSWGLALAAFSWPLYVLRWGLFGLPSTLLEGLIIVALAVFLFKNRDWRDWHWPKYGWLVGLWLAWSFLCVWVNPNWYAALGLWRAYFLEPLIFVFLALNMIKNRRDWHLMWGAIGISALLVAIFAIIQRFTGWGVPYEYWALGEGHRVTSIFAQPNFLGLFLGPLVAWFGGRAVMLGWGRGWKEIMGALAGFLAIMAAKSDGALIGIVGGFLAAGLWFKKTRYWAIAGVAAVVLILAIPNPVGTQILHKFTRQEWSTAVRIELWQETGDMLQQNWLLGAGIGGYQTKMEAFHRHAWSDTFPYPHNIFLSVWSEVGLPGLILFLGLLLVLVRSWWLAGRERAASKLHSQQKSVAGTAARMAQVGGFADWRFPLLWAVLTLLIHGLVDTPYFKNDLAMLFWWLWLVPMLAGRLDFSPKKS